MSQIRFEVGDVVRVPYKSLNEWNEGHWLSGPIVEVKGNQIKVDLPFESRDHGWYDASVAQVVRPLRMTAEQREDILSRRSRFVLLGDDARNRLIADMIVTGEGADMLAQWMIEPVRWANL